MPDNETQALIAALLADLEGAECGSAALDERIYEAAGRPGDRDPQEYAFLHGDCPPPYSQSIDAALTLVPDGWLWTIEGGSFGANAAVTEEVDADDDTGRSSDLCGAPTPALALCIASLSVREAEE